MSFVNGEEYRVALQTSTGTLKVEGTLVSYDYPAIWLNVDGIRTFFSAESGTMLYIQMIDRQAEDTAEKEKLAQRKAFYS